MFLKSGTNFSVKIKNIFEVGNKIECEGYKLYLKRKNRGIDPQLKQIFSEVGRIQVSVDERQSVCDTKL